MILQILNFKRTHTHYTTTTNTGLPQYGRCVLVLKKSKTQRFSHLRHHLPPHQWVSLGTKWTRDGGDGSEMLQCRGLRALPTWTWHTAHREAAPRATYALSSLFQHWLRLRSSYPTGNKKSLPLHTQDAQTSGSASLHPEVTPWFAGAGQKTYISHPFCSCSTFYSGFLTPTGIKYLKTISEWIYTVTDDNDLQENG